MPESLSAQAILEKLEATFPGKITAYRPGSSSPQGAGGEARAIVDREHLRPVLAFLKGDPALDFNFLTDVTAVDHLLLETPEVGERFSVVYQLSSLTHGHRFQVKARVPEGDPVVPSVCDLWKAALWGEREVHDMFGIEFEGNPDMRRFLMPEDFPGYPLRKDYPLHGRGERDAFPKYSPESGVGGVDRPHRETR